MGLGLSACLLACGGGGPEPELTDEVEREASADPGLVGRWRFRESSGTSVADSSGSGNNGTLKNGASLVPALSNSAVQLDGVNDFVEVPSSSSLQITGSITLSLWVDIQSTGRDQIFIGKPYSTSTHASPYFAYSLHAKYVDGRSVLPRFFLSIGGTAAFIAADRTISTGWHHLAGTYDGSRLKIYVDGVLSGSTAKTGRIATYPTPLRFGINGGMGEPAKGRLDDIRIYSRALPACEVGLLNGQAGCPLVAADAGAGLSDAGAIAIDAGTAARDAGTTPADAGTTASGSAGYPPANATPLTVDGFESGSISAWNCSGNCPTVATSPVADGRYSGRFELTPSMPTEYRTEVVARNGTLLFNKEHWITMKYRFEDWAADTAADAAPLQIHMTPYSWSDIYDSSGNKIYDVKLCTKSVSSAWSNAPFFMATHKDPATGQNVSTFRTHRGRVLKQFAVDPGRWHSLRIHFKISWSSDGFIEAWRDDEYLGSVSGPNTVQLDDCGKPFRPQYFKMGIYKWPWRDYTGGVSPPKTESSRRLLYIDSVGIYRKD